MYHYTKFDLASESMPCHAAKGIYSEENISATFLVKFLIPLNQLVSPPRRCKTLRQDLPNIVARGEIQKVCQKSPPREAMLT